MYIFSAVNEKRHIIQIIFRPESSGKQAGRLLSAFGRSRADLPYEYVIIQLENYITHRLEELQSYRYRDEARAVSLSGDAHIATLSKQAKRRAGLEFNPGSNVVVNFVLSVGQRVIPRGGQGHVAAEL